MLLNKCKFYSFENIDITSSKFIQKLLHIYFFMIYYSKLNKCTIWNKMNIFIHSKTVILTFWKFIQKLLHICDFLWFPIKIWIKCTIWKIFSGIKKKEFGEHETGHYVIEKYLIFVECHIMWKIKYQVKDNITKWKTI